MRRVDTRTHFTFDGKEIRWFGNHVEQFVYKHKETLKETLHFVF